MSCRSSASSTENRSESNWTLNSAAVPVGATQVARLHKCHLFLPGICILKSRNMKTFCCPSFALPIHSSTDRSARSWNSTQWSLATGSLHRQAVRRFFFEIASLVMREWLYRGWKSHWWCKLLFLNSTRSQTPEGTVSRTMKMRVPLVCANANEVLFPTTVNYVLLRVSTRLTTYCTVVVQ